MIKQLLKQLIQEQESNKILLYIQTSSRSLQIIHIETANEDFLQVVLANKSKVIINSKLIEYFTIDLSERLGADIFETSIEYLEEILYN